jgi:hypothetical protein
MVEYVGCLYPIEVAQVEYRLALQEQVMGVAQWCFYDPIMQEPEN